MHFFLPSAQGLCADGFSLEDIATTYGTPCYVYSGQTLQRHLQVFKDHLTGIRHVVCYAVKANSTMAILRSIARQGYGFDAISGGELARLMQLDLPMQERVIFSGVGKSDGEIRAALTAQVRYICVESLEELQAIDQISCSMGHQAAVTLRINPEVDGQTHPKIATALKESKFGIDWQQARAICQYAHSLSHVQLVGISCHIGSQITSLDPFLAAGQKMLALLDELQALGLPLQYFGMGGGLGIVYDRETPPSLASYCQALRQLMGQRQQTLILEPGRVLVGNCGVLLTTVLRCKEQGGKRFIIVDGGMNDLLRPALYDAYHRIEPVRPRQGPKVPVEIVGPVCETGDSLGSQRLLPPIQTGDRLVVFGAGAYGSVMSSRYNSRVLAPEILCDAPNLHLIRRREEVEACWQNEYDLDGKPFGKGSFSIDPTLSSG